MGLISFCLVIYYGSHTSLESGLVTVFSNRLGDVFFLFCFFFFVVGGGFRLEGVLPTVLFFLMVFLGRVTKRAQAPFSAWLPAAIAAPTPVSSLVHSSTLVTAGVYVMIRYSFLFFFFDFLLLKVFFLFTMVCGGIRALFEEDLKKVVAMSTLSQLGMMMYVLSVGVWVLSFMHMVIHAFFKSILFLRTGVLIRNYSGGQDSRFYGGDFLSLLSFLFFFVRVLCLVGFPFFIGFYSKDFIILGRSLSMGIFFYLFFVFGCFLRVCYGFRLLKMSFGGSVVYSGFSLFKESWRFCFPVSFLFFKGWLLGGLFG